MNDHLAPNTIITSTGPWAIVLDPDMNAHSMLRADVSRWKYKKVHVPKFPEPEELAAAGYNVYVPNGLVMARLALPSS